MSIDLILDDKGKVDVDSSAAVARFAGLDRIQAKHFVDSMARRSDCRSLD
jgi:hypothetical protein